MIYISRLALDHFRSWRHIVLDFEPGITLLQGANGLGKTNIVEALEVLSTGSSHRTSNMLPLVRRGENKATVRANVREMDVRGGSDMVSGKDAGSETNGDVVTYEVSIATKGANRGRIDNGPSLYMRDIVGRVPLVSFTPDDQRLVSADPSERRAFLDQAGTMLIPGYADCLHDFMQIARQRVALLKQLGERDGDLDLRQASLSGLEVWTGQFIDKGVELTRYRQTIVDEISPHFSDLYAALSTDGRGQEQDGDDFEERRVSGVWSSGGVDEGISTSHAESAGLGREHQPEHSAELRYVPSFKEVLSSELPQPEISRHFQRLYPGEVARGRNLIGPHRDDMEFSLEGYPAREYASNGETWTLALALKMSLYRAISRRRGEKPIVVLDDVFAQLDETRRGKILDFAAQQDQVFVTVAAVSDIPDMGRLRRHAVPCKVIKVADLQVFDTGDADSRGGVDAVDASNHDEGVA